MENEIRIDEIKEKIFTRRPDLVIDRVPEKIRVMFKELAKEDFCNDYGMTLKFLVDFYFGLIPTGTEHMELRMVQLEQQMIELRQSSDKKEDDDKTIKTNNGREIGRNR